MDDRLETIRENAEHAGDVYRAQLTAQERHGWLVLPIGATLVLALLAWAAQTPTRFVPRLKFAPLVYSSPSGTYVCTASTWSAPASSFVGSTSSSTATITLWTNGSVVCSRSVSIP